MGHTGPAHSLAVESPGCAVPEGDGLSLGPRVLLDSSLAHQTPGSNLLCAQHAVRAPGTPHVAFCGSRGLSPETVVTMAHTAGPPLSEDGTGVQASDRGSRTQCPLSRRGELWADPASVCPGRHAWWGLSGLAPPLRCFSLGAHPPGRLEPWLGACSRSARSCGKMAGVRDAASPSLNSHGHGRG